MAQTARASKTGRNYVRRSGARTAPPAANAGAAPHADAVEQKDGDDAMYTVVDELCTGAPRIHDAWVWRQRRDGKRIKEARSFYFENGTPLPVPKSVALQFARIGDAFTVRTPSGARVKPARSKAEADGAVRLEPGQVVADVDELTDEALMTRARDLPGGATLPSNVRRNDLRDFVLAGGDDEDEFIGEQFEIDDDRLVEPPTRPLLHVDEPPVGGVFDNEASLEVDD